MSFLSRVARGLVSRPQCQFFSRCATFFDDVPEEEEVIPGIPYSDLTVGIVKEPDYENRVAQVPASVDDLVKKGFRVIVEKGVGERAKYPDELYKEAGAEIAFSADKVYSEADIIMRLNVPTLEDVEMMEEDQTLFSFVYPSQNEDVVDKLVEKKVTTYAMDCVPRISRAQVFDALSSQANIAGYKAVVEAASYFGGFMAGQMTAAGRVDPCKVLVIGAGVAGLAAIQTAKNMGAVVRGFDVRSAAKDQVESMGAQFLTVEIEEEGDGGGGYAKEMSDDFIKAEMDLFMKQAKDVDVVITTALIPGRPAPILFPKYIVDAMKPGSVIVDLAASAGGNVETIKPGEVYEYNGIIHVGNTDLPSRLPGTASTLYSNNIRKLLYSFGEKGHYFLDLEDDVCRGSVVTLDGELMWPPPPLEIVQDGTAGASAETAVVVEEKSMFQQVLVKSLLMAGAFQGLQAVGRVQEQEIINMFSVFTLGCIVGYKIVTNVLPALHSPLISVTNAVSGIIICGGLLLLPEVAENAYASLLGAAAVFISSVNVFGGFLITQKMLNMFKKPDDPADHNMLYTLPGLAAAASYVYMFSKGMPYAIEGNELLASVACILALGGLCEHRTARMGNLLGMTGVGLGILSTLTSLNMDSATLGKIIGLTAAGGMIGLGVASKVKLTDLPQLVALFHSFVGLAACFISFGSYLVHPNADLLHDLSVSLGSYIGGVTFTGSILAFAKLQGLMTSVPVALPGKNFWNFGLTGGALGLSAYFCMNDDVNVGIASLAGITALSFAAGAHMTAAIGGADMPVVITVLNSYSGWALCAEGFLLNNMLLTIVGSLVGASGAILSGIMCKAMNRSIYNVLFQGVKTGKAKEITGTHTETNVQTVADDICNGQHIMFIPGFGMAVSKAQYAVAEMTKKLQAAGKRVSFNIHPVAGRMPGQMNVLLAEAGVEHDIVYEMDELEDEMEGVDVVLCIGSNDIFNSSANDDPDSPIAGMPVISVWNTDKCVVLKRTMGVGYSAIDNPVFFNENTTMLLGDAKDSCDQLLAAVVERL